MIDPLGTGESCDFWSLYNLVSGSACPRGIIKCNHSNIGTGVWFQGYPIKSRPRSLQSKKEVKQRKHVHRVPDGNAIRVIR